MTLEARQAQAQKLYKLARDLEAAEKLVWNEAHAVLKSLGHTTEYSDSWYAYKEAKAAMGKTLFNMVVEPKD